MRRQSEHFDDYHAALDKLDAMRLTFPSFESRAELAHLVADRESHARWPRDPDGVPLYPGAARLIPAPERTARMAAGELRLRALLRELDVVVIPHATWQA